MASDDFQSCFNLRHFQCDLQKTQCGRGHFTIMISKKSFRNIDGSCIYLRIFTRIIENNKIAMLTKQNIYYIHLGSKYKYI